jgi:hypothetical protein
MQSGKQAIGAPENVTGAVYVKTLEPSGVKELWPVAPQNPSKPRFCVPFKVEPPMITVVLALAHGVTDEPREKEIPHSPTSPLPVSVNPLPENDQLPPPLEKLFTAM